jgi:cytochrome b561/polyisoprenoid-binding protein YceI
VSRAAADDGALLRYSRSARALHAVVAQALVVQLALGWTMAAAARANFAAYQVHKSIGITILALTFVRLIVRICSPPVQRFEPGWTGLLARAVHTLLYAFMVAAPITGWLVVSSASLHVPTMLYGVIPLPHLPIGTGWAAPARIAHRVIAWIGAMLIALHVAGAVRHHLILRDATLSRMWPRRLPVAVLLGGMAAAGVAGAALSTIPSGTPQPAGVPRPMSPSAPVIASLPPVSSVPANADARNVEPTPSPTASPSADVAVPSWEILPGGTLSFAVGLSGGGEASGRFGTWSGTVRLDPDHPANASIHVVVQTGSVSMADSSQQDMVGGADYLATAAFPEAVFQSVDVERVSNNRYRARGTFALKGSRRPMTLSFALSGAGTERAVSGSATISRAMFNVGGGDEGLGIAPDVTVRFSFHARQKR